MRRIAGVAMLLAAIALALYQAWLWTALILGLGTVTGEEYLLWAPGLLVVIAALLSIRLLRKN